MQNNLITILGPTAVGKTFLGASLADYFGGEIISADSRQVYKGMDIGTGKDLSDYIINGKTVPYHLVDVIEPEDEFNLFLFNKQFYQIFNEITSRMKIPFLVGGTGLYLHSILKNYSLNKVEFDDERYSEMSDLSIEQLTTILKNLSPSLHNTTDLLIKDRVIRAIMIAESETNNKIKSPEINSLIIGVRLEREEIKKRITARLKRRLENGMIEEVKRLIDAGLSFDRLDLFGLEYKFLGRYLKGELNYNDMFQKLNSAIHSFAKRQMTWFRKMEREGVKINWIDGPDYEAAKQIISQNYFS
ncbi:MAG: tRNA (adenosine(37)-N6)-dimethylallyltransferase MiaA [Ignavibacteriales bacterium]|nr:tRNA (adenosine(37)-N6)-dimethylallyltransferase MiaA [Ignavibacteriales bacterium]